MPWTYRVVFIGDVIDFGPHSKQAMDIVSETLKRLPGSCLILGDHEVLLLKLLDEVDWSARQKLLIKWLDDLGGSATLASYGFTGRPDELEHIKQMIGRDHVSVLRRGVRFVELENHILVHASFEPGIAPEDQDLDRMLLCPSSFLQHKESFGKVVVHGGAWTYPKAVEAYPNRISISTDVRRQRILSALHIDPLGSVHAISATLRTRDPAPLITDYPPVERSVPEPRSPLESDTRPLQGPHRRPADYVDEVAPRRGRPPRRRSAAKAKLD